MTQQPSPDIDLNGELIAAEAARISPFDRGFTLGDGIFESLRVRGGAPEFLAEHLARLRRAAAVLALPLPFDDAEMGARMARLIAANDMPEGAMRLTVSRGAAARGVATPPAADCRPTVILSLHPLPSTRHAPVAAIVATVTRRNERSPLSGIKAAPYLDNILALDEAKARGAQDAILLNTSGRVASACYANLFAVIDGRLITPPLTDGPLPGIARARVLAAMDGGEQSLTPEDLARAEEVFLTNSLGVRSVVDLDGCALPEGPIAAQARGLIN